RKRLSEDANSAGMSLAALGQKRVGKEYFIQASSRLCRRERCGFRRPLPPPSHPRLACRVDIPGPPPEVLRELLPRPASPRNEARGRGKAPGSPRDLRRRPC